MAFKQHPLFGKYYDIFPELVDTLLVDFFKISASVFTQAKRRGQQKTELQYLSDLHNTARCYLVNPNSIKYSWEEATQVPTKDNSTTVEQNHIHDLFWVIKNTLSTIETIPLFDTYSILEQRQKAHHLFQDLILKAKLLRRNLPQK